MHVYQKYGPYLRFGTIIYTDPLLIDWIILKSIQYHENVSTFLLSCDIKTIIITHHVYRCNLLQVTPAITAWTTLWYQLRKHETCVSYLLVVYVEIRYKPTDLLTLKKKNQNVLEYIWFLKVKISLPTLSVLIFNAGCFLVILVCVLWYQKSVY